MTHKLSDIFDVDLIAKVAATDLIVNNHHIFGGSVMHRRLACSASAVTEAACADIDNSNEDSRKGTDRHEQIAVLINAAVAMKQRPAGQHEGAAYDAVMAVIAEMERLGFTDILMAAEVRYASSLTSGQLDLCITGKRNGKTRAFIIDLKTGHEPICHEEQLRTYAHLLLENGVDEVYANAYSTEFGYWLFPAPIKYADCDALHFWVKNIRDAAFSPDAPFCAGDHCQYCKGKVSGRCPVIIEQEKDAVLNGTKALTVNDMSVFAAIALVMEGDITPAVIAKLDEGKEIIKRAKDYIERIEEQANDAIKKVGGTDKYSLVNVNESMRPDYKACWLAIEAPNKEEIEQANMKTVAAQVRVMPRKRGKKEAEG